MIKKINKLSNYLYNSGLVYEAGYLDDMLIKFAQNHQEIPARVSRLVATPIGCVFKKWFSKYDTRGPEYLEIDEDTFAALSLIGLRKNGRLPMYREFSLRRLLMGMMIGDPKNSGVPRKEVDKWMRTEEKACERGAS